MLKIMSVEWSYKIPFGLLHSPTPTETVKKFVETTAKVFHKDA